MSKKTRIQVDTTNVASLLSNAKKLVKTQASLSFEYIEKALNISLSKGNLLDEANCYYTLGELNQTLDIDLMAVKNYQKAITLYQKLKHNEGLLQSYQAISKSYEKLGDYVNSHRYNDLYLKLSEQTNAKDDLINAKKMKASSSAKMQDYASSRSSYEEVKKEEKERNNPQAVIDANNKIGELLIEQSNEEEALEYFQESQVIAEQINDEKSIAQAYNNMGNAYRSAENYDKELEVRQKAAKINSKSNNADALSDDRLNIADVYIKTNQPEEAIPYLEKTLEYSEAIGSIEKQAKAQKSMSVALAKSGKINDAIARYQLYVHLQDSILREKEQAILAKLEINTLVLEKQQRIDLLEKNKALRDNEILILKQEQAIKAESLKNQQIFIYSLLAVALMLVISTILILRSSRQKRIANQMLALKSLRSQMNPHFIFNALNSVNSFISTNNERAANKYLSEFSRLMRAVLDNSEHNFIPLSTEINMLELYLNLEHLRFQDKFDYQFKVQENIDLEQYEIPPMLIQPYIENAIWHGLRYKESKGFLKVEITENKETVAVLIEDNGIGRKASQEIKTKNQKAKTSTGLRNIKTRLEVLNQTYKTNIRAEISDLENNNITGTRVEIFVPQKHKNHA
ncbi:MAG: tetratricopeptide repeat protein [Bacteroidales bacterium]|nr:tetratricopeptide repeat protein [Bacteroidales bacterium]